MNHATDLDALVLAEIASLGRGAQALAATPRTDGQGGPSQRQNQPQGPQRPVATIRGGADPEGRASPGAWTGEEADGLFDEPLDLAAEPSQDPAADGPTAADLLSMEEQAFIARAVGFLSHRPNADLILDRIWSKFIESAARTPAPAPDPAPGTGSAVGLRPVAKVPAPASE